MKVVIIGGGIAGLTLGALLHQKNIDFVINEKTDTPSRGHAFLMHTDGLAILNEMSADNNVALPGNLLHTYSLKQPNNEEVKRLPLDCWKCIKRTDLIQFLTSLIPADRVVTGRQFSHFIYEDGRAVAAMFTNGHAEYGDIFAGADGSNSAVRQLLFGKTNYTPTVVKELVGICSHKDTARQNNGLFTKFSHPGKGLSFGIIPASAGELVWFMQYNAAAADVTGNSPDAIKAFCKAQLEDFPPVVTDLLNSNNFSTSYIWNTTDFDLLPAFHQQNVVLLGDAAHLALPFTSSGTTNAVIDAKVLTGCLEYTGSYQDAFEKFYRIRAAEVETHLNLGRQLKNDFLNPHMVTEAQVPLISRKKEPVVMAGAPKPVQILYFTDPICSTCWIIQPSLRKLKLEYGNYINIEYHMGGLLSCWEDGNTGSIKTPDDAARHWEEACSIYEMPIDGDIWIEDPLHSSYPPSIAFKAAQLQDEVKAIAFLRRIREMVFLEKKNIIKWAHIENAAFNTGLDCAQLLNDFRNKAQDYFRADLALAKQHGVTGFPTLFFSDQTGKQFMLRGNQPYEHFENIINILLPAVKKNDSSIAPEEIFHQFPTLTDKEFAVLSNTNKEQSARLLNSLFSNGYIEKQESKNGIIWKSRALSH